MKRTTKIGTLLMMSTLLLSACQRSGDCNCDVVDPYAKQKGNIKVSSNIASPTTRVVGEAWEASDAIGIFALTNGQAVGADSYATNAKYTTASAGARVAFTSASKGITAPSTGNIDLIAYYPYKEGTTTTVAFDTSDQSQPAAIDLLYSNNQKGLNKGQLQANLIFAHKLTKVEFDITTDGLTITNGTIALKEVVVDGSMALATGAITNGTKKGNPSVAIKATGENKYKGVMILPPQDLTGKEVTFTLDGKAHKATLKLAQTESEKRYVVEVSYVAEKLVILEGATIAPWKEGGNNGETIIIGGGDPAPAPAPTPGTDPQTPPAPTPAPGASKLFFPGADFENWTAFTGSLNKTYGLKEYATQVEGGHSGKALQIKGTPTGNDYVFTTTAQADGPKSGKKIVFYMKGKSEKTISLNLYKSDNKYIVFNLGTITGSNDVTIEVDAKNSYTGTIDTHEKWIKVTLNIPTGTQFATSGNFFALKVGKEKAYDLLFDQFTIEE